MAVIATAGHVDHGKSTLVRLLTGMEPDRLAEERRRGLTIDLGYAWTDLDGVRVSLVDVPGHEHFTANMLAGLGPVSAVMFVVAADDGWCRQSEEHARAVAALGIDDLLLVITRCDLAPGAAAGDAARRRLAALGVPVAETVLVSGRTGEGLSDLRAGLGRLAARVGEPDPDAAVRLWVDRSFTIRGAGTVVTGTLTAGRVTAGDDLVLGGQHIRVRGVQTCGEDVEAVTGPARVALNLRGVPADAIARGDALLGLQWPSPVRVVDIRRAELQPSADRPRLARELVLHVGTRAAAVRVQSLADGRVRLRLSAPLPLVIGDRAVLRDPGRHEILCGVEVVAVDPVTRRDRVRRPAADPPAGSEPATGAEPLRDLLGWLAAHPLQAPTRDQLHGWCVTQEQLASAARAGLLLRLGDGIVLGTDAVAQATARLAGIDEPFTVGDAARAWGTSRRVAVPFLQRLDAGLVTRRRPDGTRVLGPGRVRP